MRYPIVIRKDGGNSYRVAAPGLPGCFSGGDTLDDAVDMAREAIVGHIETLLRDGQLIPEQTLLQAHQANEDYAGGIWALVDVDLSKLSAKPVQVNVVMPAAILAMVEEVAEREGELRAGMLTLAMLCYVDLLTLA
jgi:predicted RNase H-like HicB family nuclease